MNSGEISFDLIIPEEGMDHIEGVYRIEGADWKVFYFTHWRDGYLWSMNPIIRENVIFQSGIGGIDAVYPACQLLNKETSKKLLSSILGGVSWVDVMGPDSLQLK